MTSNYRLYSNVNVEKEKTMSEQNDNFELNILRNYTTLYHTYQLLYCKEHIQIKSNHSNENLETEKTIKYIK